MAAPNGPRIESIETLSEKPADGEGNTASLEPPSQPDAEDNDFHAENPFDSISAHRHLSQQYKDKVDEILKACKTRNFDELQRLATTEGGLIDDEVRRTAWPVLLGSDVDQLEADSNWSKLDKHREEEQVELDVNRSFVYYPSGESEARKDARKQELSNVITAVLRRHKMLHYFQGYHDIVQVILLVLGANAAIPAAARLSLLRIRDFMLPTMSGTEPHLKLVPSILYAADPKLCHHLSQTQPFFALAATLTLYAHDIEEYGDIARLFDFLLANEAVMSLYLYAAIVLSRKKELLEVEPEEPEMLHFILSKLPKPLDLEGLITRAAELYQNHPPENLPGRAWSHISSNSVLKTTHDSDDLAKQTLQDGERFYDKQDAEIKRADAWKAQQKRIRALAKHYKGPITYTGAAFIVALLALAFRDSNVRSMAAHLSPVIIGLHQRASELIKRYLA